MWNMWTTDHKPKQLYRNDYNDHIGKQMIIQTYIQWSIIVYGCMHVQHTNMMWWEQQSIIQSTIKPTRKQTKQSFLINTMSSPPWYTHLPYGISLPLQMCTRNRISPPKDVHKCHTEMTKLSGILL